MKRTFIEFGSVTRLFEASNVTDEAVRAMQNQIMRDEGDLIRGTGGLRKIRCSGSGRGKSGGVRVIYADYPDVGKCLLIVAFAKNVQENLDKAQQNELAKMKAALDKLMKSEAKQDAENEEENGSE